MPTCLVTSIRDRQTQLIGQNPASIVITRVTKTANTGGGFDTASDVKKAQTVRIYDKGEREILVAEPGFSTTRETKMIAEYDADILPRGAENVDTFPYDGKTYEVKDVKNEYTFGSIVFKTCRLEKL